MIQSSQLEYDQRKLANHPPFDPKGFKVEQSPFFNENNNENDKNKIKSITSSAAAATTTTTATAATTVGRAINIKVVDTVEKAQAVLKIMYAQQKANPHTVWACDTEVADIDLSLVGT